MEVRGGNKDWRRAAVNVDVSQTPSGATVPAQAGSGV